MAEKSKPQDVVVAGRVQELDEKDAFVRLTNLEPFFVGIQSSPIVKATVTDGAVRYDASHYQPNAIDFFYDRGFYPACFDPVRDQLIVMVCKQFEFPDDLVPAIDPGDPNDQDPDWTKRDRAIEAFRDGLAFYCQAFFNAIPKEFSSKFKAKGIDFVDFRYVDRDIFDGLVQYVKDPSQIRVYQTNQRIADNREKGLTTENVDSVASEILDLIMQHAIMNDATDVHIEYDGRNYKARIRVDGDLRDYQGHLNPKYYSALISVIKIRCEIDVVEHFRPQDGMFTYSCAFAGNQGGISSYYDIRVSIIPQADGRLNAVLRIQPKGTFRKLEELGFTPVVHDGIKKLCLEPHGLILVTGPTGSGKTTTLYSILNELNKEDVKILTAEDPPEIRMVGLTQVAIHEKQGRTFPILLRSFLRHDPDIILVGEIRDGETAKLAIEAANTGHLVLSTLHTNDAVSAIKRLGRMEGVDTADFAFSLKGVLAQRLIKTFRPSIRDVTGQALKEGVIHSDGVLRGLIDSKMLEVADIGKILNELIGERFFPEDLRMGFKGLKPEAYSGRTAITEYWRIGPKAADLIFNSRFNTFELAKVALENDKMLPMAITGIEKVTLGISSIEEVLKGTGVDALLAHRHDLMRSFFENPK